MFYIEKNTLYEEVKIGSNIIKTAIDNVNKIKLDSQSTTINTLINIPIICQKFNLEQQQYVTDTSIYKDVEIYLDGNLIGTETILNGIGNIEFESAEAGTFKITVENYSCEVIVNA